MQQYQVSELTDKIKKLFEQSFLGLIMVHGEVTEFSRASSGHCYFSLKDENAKLKAAYFRRDIRPDSFLPKNGDQVSAIGELRVYPPDGSYQLIVRKVIYSQQGEFWKKFEESKLRLAAEGLFDPSTKRPLPLYPKRIAVLTAATGAAVKDFAVTASRNGLFFTVHVWPIPVQGKEAVSHIVQAIEKAGSKEGYYDVLILTRGGGSLDDLAVFNEEAVARALKKSLVPTVSAIGHERDVTICDMVADERAATPTAAAERLILHYIKSVSNINIYHNKLLTLLRLRLENANLGFDRLEAKLKGAGALSRLERERGRLSRAVNGIYNGLTAYCAVRRKKLQSLESELLSASPHRQIRELRHRVELLYLQAAGHINNRLTSEQHRLEMTNQRLVLTDPERMLSLGYSLILKDGHAVTGIDSVHLEDEVEVKMKDGSLSAYITGKKSIPTGSQ